MERINVHSILDILQERITSGDVFETLCCLAGFGYHPLAVNRDNLLHYPVGVISQWTMFFYSHAYVGGHITEFFKKNGMEGVSPTTLAKVIETNAYKSIPEEVRETMKTLADFRRHSLDTQAKFYIH